LSRIPTTTNLAFRSIGAIADGNVELNNVVAVADADVEEEEKEEVVDEVEVAAVVANDEQYLL